MSETTDARPIPLLDDAQKSRLAARLKMMNRNRGDSGQILEATRRALALEADGDNGAARLEALADALTHDRVIVPIAVEEDPRATGGHTGLDGDGQTPTDFVRVDCLAGKAIAVFSSADQLRAFDALARPTALAFRSVAFAALVETGGRVVMDPAGSNVVIPRPVVAALAQGDTWLPAWKDQELAEELKVLAQVRHNGTSPIVDVQLTCGAVGNVTVTLFVNANADQRGLKKSLMEAVSAIGDSKRLQVSADRIEIVPRWVSVA